MSEKLNFINALRLAAAIWVLIFHTMVWGGWLGVPIPDAKIAVDLFMMISGYLMVHNAFRRAETEPLGTGSGRLYFWTRRIFRIAPLYFVCLIAMFLLGNFVLGGYRDLQLLTPQWWPDGGQDDPRGIHLTPESFLLHATFIFGLLPRYSHSTFLPDWSLSLEMQFYGAFPFIWLAMRRFGYAITAMFCVLVSAGFQHIFLDPLHFGQPSVLPMKIQYFLAGILLHRVADRATPSAEAWSLAALGVVLVGIERGLSQQSVVTVLVYGTMLGLAMTASRRSDVRSTPDLLNRFVFSPGADLSYGIYLVHGFIIATCGIMIARTPALTALPPASRVAGMLIVVLVGSIIVSWALVHLIERPGIDFGNRQIRRLKEIANAKGAT